MKEVWKKIKGFEDYEVSNMGNVRRNKGDKYISIKPSVRWPQNHGRKSGRKYVCVTLSQDGKRESFSVHRLVATLFLPNPNNYPEVNHINGIKDDNRIENLEWCTHKQNALHQYDCLGYQEKYEGVKQYTKEGEFVQHYDSPRKAARALGIGSNAITKCAKRQTNIAGGYVWRFDSDNGDVVYKNKTKRKVVMLTLWGEEVEVFDSLIDASRKTGVDANDIYCCCSEKCTLNRAGGYIWRYLDKYDKNEFSVFHDKKIVEKTKNGVYVKTYQSVRDLIESTHHDIMKIKRGIIGEVKLPYNRKWEIC